MPIYLPHNYCYLALRATHIMYLIPNPLEADEKITLKEVLNNLLKNLSSFWSWDLNLNLSNSKALYLSQLAFLDAQKEQFFF